MAYINSLTLTKFTNLNLFQYGTSNFSIEPGSDLSSTKSFVYVWLVNGEEYNATSRNTVSLNSSSKFYYVTLVVPVTKGTLQLKLVGAGDNNQDVLSDIVTLDGKVRFSKYSPACEVHFLNFKKDETPVSFNMGVSFIGDYSKFLTLKTIDVYVLENPDKLMTITSADLVDNTFTLPAGDYKWLYYVANLDHIDGFELINRSKGENHLKYYPNDGQPETEQPITEFWLKDSKGNKFAEYPLNLGSTDMIYGSFLINGVDTHIKINDTGRPLYASVGVSSTQSTLQQFSINDDYQSNYADGSRVVAEFYPVYGDVEIKPGDVLDMMCMYYTGEPKQAKIGEVVAKEYDIQLVDPSRFKLKTMPPIDPDKNIWHCEYDPALDFVANSDTNVAFCGYSWDSGGYNLGEAFYFGGTKSTVLLNRLFDLEEIEENNYPVRYSIGHYSSVIYPTEQLIVKIGDQNTMLNTISFYPLVLTHKEKVKISQTGTIANGSAAQLTANPIDFSPINQGVMRYQWKKDGVEIPKANSKSLRFDKLSSDNTGSYTVVSTAYPSGAYADDSLISVESEPFVINLGQPIKMDVTITAPDTITDGVEFTISGTLDTDNAASITSIDLEKNNIIIKNFPKTATTFEYKKVAESGDEGNYQFVVLYTDGGVDKIALSPSKPVAFTDAVAIELKATLDITSPIDEGQTATLTAKVEIIQKISPVIEYQWYFRNAILPGANQAVLTIPNATFLNNAGDYFFKASVSQAGYIPTQVQSETKELVIKHNIHLVPTVRAEQDITADGIPTNLSVTFTSDVPVVKTWDWYYNGTKIPGTTDKASISHAANGDATYFVKAKALREESGAPVLGLEVTSNTVMVRGVISVENLTLRVDGPTKVNETDYGSRLELRVDLSKTVIPPGSNPIKESDYTYEWYNDKGQRVSSNVSYITSLTANTLGTYYYIVRSRIDPSFTKRSPNHRVYVDGSVTPGTCIKYIHDLMPGRDACYIWMGWWVIDEIYEAQMEGFDWLADPTNDRFVYKCDLETLAKAIHEYPEIEVQESRNGYILTRKDLVI